MADETTSMSTTTAAATVTDTKPASTTTTAAATVPTFKFADPNGKLVEGWKNNLPEEYRGEKCLDLFDDVIGMAKTVVHGQKAMGKNKVVLPTDTSPQADWDAYFEAIGRPKTKEDYKAEKPKDLPDELWDKELVSQLTEAGWKLGWTQRHVDSVLGIYTGYQKKLAEAQAQAAENEKAEAEAALRKEWGPAYDQKLDMAKAFLRKTADDEQREYLEQLAGNNLLFVKWLSDWGMKTSEAKGLDTSQLKKTPAAAMARIAELEATPGYMNGELKKNDPAKFKSIMQERDSLYREAYPE